MTDLLIKLVEIKDVLESMAAPPPYTIKMTREGYKQLLQETESRGIVLRKGDGFDRIFGMTIEVEDDPSEIHRPRTVRLPQRCTRLATGWSDGLPWSLCQGAELPYHGR